MIQTLSTWLLAAALFGAGIFNALGTRSTREGFARWGYPRGWWWLTGGLEILAAFLLAGPATRVAGLLIASAVIVAAAATILRHRDWGHAPPIGAFLLLILVAALGELSSLG